jgi:tetratricopeptide (TPR) repeat protein
MQASKATMRMPTTLSARHPRAAGYRGSDFVRWHFADGVGHRPMTTINPKIAFAYNNRGNADHDRAIADYNRAIEIDPKTKVYNSRGWAYYLKNDYDRAIGDASVAVSLDPKYRFAYHTRGEAYRAKGAYDRALSDFNQALALDPTHLASLASHGMTYEAMGEREKAIENYSRSHSLAATTKDAKYYQAEAAKRLANLKSAPTVTALPAVAPNATAAGRRIALLIGNQRKPLTSLPYGKQATNLRRAM